MVFESNDRAVANAEQQQPSLSINDVVMFGGPCDRPTNNYKPNAAWDQLNQNQRQKGLSTDDQGVYTVERGDTLYTIAERSLKMKGVGKPGFKAAQAEMSKIVEANMGPGIHCNLDNLAVGAKLVIPSVQERLAQAAQEPRERSQDIAEAAPQEPIQLPDEVIEPGTRADGAPVVVQGVEQVGDIAPSESDAKPASNAQPADAILPKEPKFYGLDIGLLKLGVTSDGSLNVGANVGIARGDVKVGLNNRVEAGVGIDQLGARGGAGLGINKHGIHADAGASANVAKVIDIGASAGVQVGPRSGLLGNLRGKVGPAFTDAGTTFNMGSDGVNFNAGGAAGIDKVIQGRADTRLGLNDNSHVGADAGIGTGPVDLSVGTDVTSNGNSVIRPGVHLDASDKNEQSRLEVAAQVGPKLDASVGVGANHAYLDTGETSGSDASLGIGFSGVGAKSTEWKGDEVKAKSIGVGKDF